MAEITPVGGYEKPIGGEKYSRAMTNRNLDRNERDLIEQRRAKIASFNMAAARSSTPGAGVNWGNLAVDNGRGTMNFQNDFCELANTGTAGTADEKGRIRITREGIYNLSANFTCTANPGQLNFAMVVDKIEGGSEKITMSRNGTYGDWEACVAKTGVLLKVGDYISGYQANSNGVLWAMGMIITYVGANS